ncbi:MAG: hypothetical protein FP824_06580 [Euryarchaeota archaeon]|nr:hypothetical protein [Euryarchaeota archaeon]MBU4032791.1 hypothetical protein [Candidatus Thermoplasmatota archaeon]MBU4144055.1 hypothetical protein [Candidatus Thermoplasmatota archaeon]
MFGKKKPDSHNTEVDMPDLKAETQRRIESMTQAHQSMCLKGNRNVANWYHSMLFYLYDVQRLLENPSNCFSPIPRYMFSSMLVAEIFNYLDDGTPDEKFCYCTGIIDKRTNTIMPTKLLGPDMSIRNPGYVKGDWRSIHTILSELDEWHHAMLAQCHLHPGTGPDSTHPSGIDIRNHQGLETNYPVIGAIFVRDGYLRFFSAEKEFEVEIYGKGVKKIADKLYFIENNH